MRVPGPCRAAALLFVPLVAAPVARGAIYAADPFPTGAGGYTSGSALNGQGPAATGFTGTWTGSTGFTVSSTSLPFSAGGAVTVAPASDVAGSIQRPLAEGGTPSDPFYFSGVMQISQPSTVETDGNAYMAFLDTSVADTGGINFGPRIGFENGNLVFRRRTGTAAIASATIQGGFAADTPYFFIGRIDINTSGTDDSVKIWLNPADPSSEAAAGAATLTLTDDSAVLDDASASRDLDLVRFETVDMFGSTVTFDAPRAASTWAEVVPEPASAGLLAFAAAGLLARRRRA